ARQRDLVARDRRAQRHRRPAARPGRRDRAHPRPRQRREGPLMAVLGQVSSRPIVKVGGSALSDPAFASLIGAVVVDRLTAPDMFELVFADPDRVALSDAGLEIGVEVEIEAETGTEGELLN